MACKLTKSEAFLQCLGIPPAEPITPEMRSAVERAGTLPGEETEYALACLQIRRVIYTKAKDWGGINVANLTGTCPEEDTAPKSAIATTAFAGASGITGSAASLATAGTALASTLGFISFGIGLIALPFAFLARHAQAVRLEQATICAVASAYNQLAETLEIGLVTGELEFGKAEQEIVRFRDVAVNELSKIRKECNFACGLIHTIDALVLYNREVLLQRFASKAPLLKGKITQTGLGIAAAATGAFALTR